MNEYSRKTTKVFVLLCLGLCVSKLYSFDLFSYLDSAGSNDITAVSSRKSKSYVRIQLGNGTFVPESYVFGPGGVWQGDKVDDSIDKLKFKDVAQMIAGPLASQNYVLGKDLYTTKLLIMVYWGTSHGTEHASESNGYQNLQSANSTLSRAESMVKVSGSGKDGARANQVLHEAQDQLMTAIGAATAENAARDQADVLNVNMLGYDSWWESTDRYENTPMRFRRQDLLDEIEEDRYFVVLMAYDLQAMRRLKKARLLWETRFSIRERHHAFNEDLPSIAKYASKYFGQDSHGLVHDAVPLGHVNIGAVKSLGEAPDTGNPKSGLSH